MAGQPASAAEAVADRGARIVIAAKAAALAAAGTPYTYGGKTVAGFDCSGFVYYVLRKVFPDYQYLTADGIAASPLFTQVTPAQPGDVIYFPPGPNPYEVQRGNRREFPAHVGIVVDSAWWIGRQSSTLGQVARSNVWWAARSGVKYFRYAGAQRTSVIHLQHRSRLTRYA